MKITVPKRPASRANSAFTAVTVRRTTRKKLGEIQRRTGQSITAIIDFLVSKAR